MTPELFARWVGPDTTHTRIDHWDAHSGGSWRYVSVTDDGVEFAMRGCFHDVRRPGRIVQTFTFEREPDGVALQTTWFEDLGNGRTRLRTQSLVDSFDGRDGMLKTFMRTDLDNGYAKLDRILINDNR